MSLKKLSDVEWEYCIAGDERNTYEYIKATPQGLDIAYDHLSWSELDAAREAAYKEANVIDMSKSREDFEASIRKLNPSYPLIFKQWSDGTYCQNEVQHMWKGWQIAFSILENLKGK